MRKFTLIFLVIISILIYINNKEEVKEIRVRVVPNSDSEVDLLVKEDVKNIIIEYLGQIIFSAPTQNKNYRQFESVEDVEDDIKTILNL